MSAGFVKNRNPEIENLIDQMSLNLSLKNYSLIISIPDELKSNYEGYNYFAELAAKTILTRGQIVLFDFSNCVFFEGNLCAIFGSVLDGLVQRKNVINFISRILH